MTNAIAHHVRPKSKKAVFITALYIFITALQHLDRSIGHVAEQLLEAHDA
jgi:hypothetical protein